MDRIDVGEQPPDEPVDPLERGAAQCAELLGGGEVAVEIGAEQVGPLHEHDPARSPGVGEARVRDVEVHPHTEGRARRGFEEITADVAEGHGAVAGHHRVHRGPLVLRQRIVDDRLRAVGVGDDAT